MLRMVIGSAPNNRLRIEIAGYHAVEPFQQGKLDGMCALYAELNGLQLTLHKCGGMPKAQAKDLFARGVGYLDRKGGLNEAISNGMGIRRWHGLIRA